MPAVTKGDVVEGGVDELVLQCFALGLAHLGKAEGVEGSRILVVHIVMMCRVRSRDDESALGKERAVTQGDILHNLARERC